MFTQNELETAAKHMKNNKAPGLDGTPSEIMKIIAEDRPEVLLKMFNFRLMEDSKDSYPDGVRKE